MYLVFDTETTDLFNKHIPLDDPAQARICQLAFIILDKDFNEVRSFSTLIKPNGWTINPGAEAVTHISTAMCEQYGMPIQLAYKVFEDACESVKYRIAHNSTFDTSMLDVECAMNAIQFDDWSDVICTMKLMTNICKIPTKYPGGKFKWPKLSEAYNHCFGKTFEKAHDALADVRACAAVFKWLISKNEVIFPT